MKIGSLTEIKKILLQSIQKYNSVGIITHKNPDGDGFGSALVLQEIFQNSDIYADIILEESVPQMYDFLQGSERAICFSENLYYKVLIILDCHESSRTGVCESLISNAEVVIVIDHHEGKELIPQSENYIDTDIVCVGAILYRMFYQEIQNLPSQSSCYIAQAIYVTILNDTENFLNANTDAETYRICSELMQFNIEPGKITEQFLLNKPALEMRFIGEVLSTIETHINGQVLFMKSTRDMLKRNRLISSANSKLTRWVKGTRNVKVIVCFQEVNNMRYRLSLRSDYINVNKIAVKFGGGGHIKASGCEIIGGFEEIKRILLKEFKELL
jgi:phosphoesterase RecJ-like protein